MKISREAQNSTPKICPFDKKIILDWLILKNRNSWRIFENQIEMPFYEVDLHLLRIFPSVRMCPFVDKDMEDN